MIMKFRFNEYCPLKNEKICEAECIEIASELDRMKTEEHLIRLRRVFNLTNYEMLKICESCPNYESEC